MELVPRFRAPIPRPLWKEKWFKSHRGAQFKASAVSCERRIFVWSATEAEHSFHFIDFSYLLLRFASSPTFSPPSAPSKSCLHSLCHVVDSLLHLFFKVSLHQCFRIIKFLFSFLFSTCASFLLVDFPSNTLASTLPPPPPPWLLLHQPSETKKGSISLFMNTT